MQLVRNELNMSQPAVLFGAHTFMYEARIVTILVQLDRLHHDRRVNVTLTAAPQELLPS